ncbi:MAG: hypothetical protein ABJD11_06395 [Gemmatimonadota bacterium]
MDGDTIAFMKGVISFVLVAVTGMSAYWMRLRARGGDETRLLREDVDRLGNEVVELRRALEIELPESQQRLDFLERHISQLPPPARIERPEPTPV